MGRGNSKCTSRDAYGDHAEVARSDKPLINKEKSVCIYRWEIWKRYFVWFARVGVGSPGPLRVFQKIKRSRQDRRIGSSFLSRTELHHDLLLDRNRVEAA